MSEDRIKRQILGLMAKTSENGCSEEEAMAASEKVQALLHKYQLTLSDIELQDSVCITSAYDVGQKSDAMVSLVLTAIGEFTDCKVWREHDLEGYISYKFFGLEHDVLIAEYITKICDWAIVYGAEDFKDDPMYQMADKRRRPKMKKSFQQGMATRLSQRILKMKIDQRKADIETTGRDLVVVKGAVVQSEWEKQGIVLSRGRRTRSKTVDPYAYGSGKTAADKVQLNEGVSHNPNEQLGRS
jgi:hypothetical protein